MVETDGLPQPSEHVDGERSIKAGVILTYESTYIKEKFESNQFELRLNNMVQHLANIDRDSFDSYVIKFFHG
eukprot:CAMPEP_0116911190 /NCGR_PEP_ID=MMETSP0467-20121206/15332_1 /TAXON_ID=283647 /ORGANISM="Mesodinium pulex, Strain SPMC105" /LENGTH=71 /DNA_ID=CAMNT_0004586909 /DNA_START=470 /DNA_END=685 /DNA_ORIENTATION=-